MRLHSSPSKSVANCAGVSRIVPSMRTGAPCTSTVNVPDQDPSSWRRHSSVWVIVFVGFSAFFANPGRSTSTARVDTMRTESSSAADSTTLTSR